MTTTRREFIARLAGTIGAIGIIIVAPRPAHACLGGTWVVRCRNGHDDVVTQGTCQHVCEKCGVQAFSGSVVTVICPAGHANRVDTGEAMESHKCSNCGKECRRDLEGSNSNKDNCPRC